MKNTFVQIDEKQPFYREKIVRNDLRMSDDTPGIVCMKLLNDTPGRVEWRGTENERQKGRKNLCTA